MEGWCCGAFAFGQRPASAVAVAAAVVWLCVATVAAVVVVVAASRFSWAQGCWTRDPMGVGAGRESSAAYVRVRGTRDFVVWIHAARRVSSVEMLAYSATRHSVV